MVAGMAQHRAPASSATLARIIGRSIIDDQHWIAGRSGSFDHRTNGGGAIVTGDESPDSFAHRKSHLSLGKQPLTDFGLACKSMSAPQDALRIANRLSVSPAWARPKKRKSLALTSSP